MKLVLKGKIPSKKNSKIIVCRNGRPLLLSSKNYREWHEEQSWLIKKYIPKQPIKKCKIEMAFYSGDKRLYDLSNKAESAMDFLVDNKIIEDDNYSICSELLLKFGGIDKINPRVEIEIYEEEQRNKV